MKHPGVADSSRNQMAGNIVKMSWRNSQLGLKIQPSPCSTQENKVLQMPFKLHIYFCTYLLLPHLFWKAGKRKMKEYNYFTLYIEHLFRRQ